MRASFPGRSRFPRYSPPWVHQVALEMIPRTAAGRCPSIPPRLYAAIDGLVLLLLLSAFYPLRRRDGEVMGLLMLTYPVTRFLVELLRNDEGVFFAGMTISQNISVALFAAGSSTGPGSRAAEAACTVISRTDAGAARSRDAGLRRGPEPGSI